MQISFIIDIAAVAICVPILVILVLRGRKYYNENICKTAQPNEWMLVIDKQGRLVNSGIGIMAILGLNDKYVTFPSAVHQVEKNFQGLKVSGILVWSINRENDGPFKAYKYFGDTLKQANPVSADRTLSTMAEAVVRHTIANSDLEDILGNRNMIREAIKKEMMEVVKGWGIWLETIEITDVLICSSQLFSDLQIENRELSRLEAQKIKLDTWSKLEEQKTKREIEMFRSEKTNSLKNEIANENNFLKKKLQQIKVNSEKKKDQLKITFENKKLEAEKTMKQLENEEKNLQEMEKLKIEKEQKDLEINITNREKESEQVMQKNVLDYARYVEESRFKVDALKEDQEELVANFEVSKKQRAAKIETDQIGYDMELERKKRVYQQIKDYYTETNQQLDKLDLVGYLSVKFQADQLKFITNGNPTPQAEMLESFCKEFTIQKN